MIRKITLIFLLVFGMSAASYAQPKCGYDVVHQQLINTDATYAQYANQMNSDIAQWLNTHQNINSLLTTNSNNDTLFEIPVVVHVMHTGGAVGSIYNITDTRINNTIDYLNQVFAATWTGYPGPGSGGTFFPFKFVLAKRSPNCTATSGINRVDVTSFNDYDASGYDYDQYGVRTNFVSGPGVRDDSLKDLSRWPRERYYNIWVVNRINGNDGTSGSFTAGYAYPPGVSSNLDGCVILATQMNINRTTLPHEIGHSFNLQHTFEDSNPSSSICLMTNTNDCTVDGDGCCDTQPHYQYGAGTCFSGMNNACVTGNFDDATAKNIMNYANCQDRFTEDQRDRMIAAVMHQNRRGLISSSASLAIPTPGLPTVCTPGLTGTGTQSGVYRVRIDDPSRTYMDVRTQGGYSQDGNITYRDFTCQNQVRLKAGETYSLTVNSFFNDSCIVYIDYNNDGNMGNGTDERLDLTAKPSPNNNIHTINFTVPLTATSCTPIRMRVICDRTNGYIDSCSDRISGQTEDYEMLIFGVPNTNDTVTITDPPAGGNPSCTNDILTFRSTPSTGTTVIGYQWIKNHTEITGATDDTIQGNGTVFAHEDTVWVKMYFATACGFDSVESNKVVVYRALTVPPAVKLSIDKGTNPTCIDDTIRFKADLVSNPGGAPTFQWRSNGTNIPGATGQFFDAYNRIGEEISVIMFSSSNCASPTFAVSDTIKIAGTTKTPVANIALTIGTNPGCAGQTLQFTVTPQTGGTAPTYQWTVNGTPVFGQTGTTYSTSTLNDNDLVRVLMTSSSACATPKSVVSNSIKVIHQFITADVNIAQTTGGNPACEGKSIIFSANTTNAGSSPQFQWLINGVPAVGATSPIYVTDTLKNNTDVQCVLIATDPCVANPRDTSSAITMRITPSFRPSVTVSITDGKNPGCLDSLVEFTANPVDLGTAPAFEWIVNGFPAGTGNVFSTSSLLDGNTVLVRANQTDNGCYLPDTVYSQPIVMKRSVTPKAPVISLIGNMMYTNFDSSFVWFGPGGEMPDGPEGKAHPDNIGSYYAVTNNNGCWSAPSNILRITLLDISSIDLSDMKVYPNPTSDKVVLDWGSRFVTYSVDVYNATGQIVKHEEIDNANRKEINLGSLAAGNYFLLLKDTAGKVGVVKVTLEGSRF